MFHVHPVTSDHRNSNRGITRALLCRTRNPTLVGLRWIGDFGEANVRRPERLCRMKNLKTKLERTHRTDRHLAVASVALMVFMVMAGFGAWMFGNSRAAYREPAPIIMHHA